ncbi:putative dynein intermediate chain [Lyophyllum shimeji]|uniref:Dynein intermediate chain n=1 Tax=Lyophyllum shimeji TaxID=47721 RepID=A0A9P3PUT6_LYOSH|nr:putative dynein intermediate chain [Lyophyllum shimeji]
MQSRASRSRGLRAYILPPSFFEAMSDKRRAEIEAKRAKLAELRKARADRLKADSERRTSEIAGPPPARKDLDDLVNSLVGSSSRSGRESGERSPSSVPGTPSIRDNVGLPAPSTLSMSGSGRASRQSDFAASVSATPAMPSSSTDHLVEQTLTPRLYADLIDVEQELFELPRKERVSYNKEVQTAAIETESPADYEEELRQRIQREREIEAERLARDKELEEESVKLDLEIEQEIRELSEEERASILAAPEFLDFVEQSSKIVQRALNDGYDYIRDYTIGAESGGDDSEGRVKRVCEFYDERYGKNRSITDVDWSPKYPELSVASYNKNPAALNEPDGIVAVWNLHLLERPEFVFHSQSDVLSVTFSPFHSNLVFGGTYSGQILLWDTRSKHLPVLKTPLSAAGHTHPVYAMQMVGTQNAHNLITSSTDGTVCSWLVDMLAQPQETLELVHAGHNKTGEVAITCLDFPDNETTTFWVGTEEGNVYQANRYDRAGAKAGLNQYDVYKGHAGPVMGLHFHPLVGPVDFSDLFLTSSVDWTVKLWRAKSLAKPSTTPQAIAPLYSFDEADDYVYDVKWHPAHPATFGTVDGSGHFDVWNLNTDTEVPAVSTSVGSGRAINKLEWDRKDGRRAALGGSDGRLYVYDIGDMAIPRETEWTDMQKTIAGIVGGGQANGVAEAVDPSRSVSGR